MHKELSFDNVAIHASFNLMSARRDYKADASSRTANTAENRKGNKEVANLLFGIGACMLVSLCVGVAVLLLNLPKYSLHADRPHALVHPIKTSRATARSVTAARKFMPLPAITPDENVRRGFGLWLPH